jgi:cardiolipin synthase C
VRCVRESPSLEALLRGEQQLTWSAQVEVVADDPHKVNRGVNRGEKRGANRGDRGEHPGSGRAEGRDAIGGGGGDDERLPGVFDSVIRAIDSARSEILLISPYFVPGARGTEGLGRLAQRGVHVSVLTNSLAATDVAAVHSGYSRYRTALLRLGVRLFELKASVAGDEERRRMRLGSSRASLHTKAAIVDRERIFVGSFNLDPRSAELNCEMGVWMRSLPLARELQAIYAPAMTPEVSYTVTLGGDGQPRWIETQAGRRFEYQHDPYASWARRAITWLLQRLPIESQL